MTFKDRKIAGALLFVGVVQVILIQTICQTVYPNYLAGQQAISDLGNWSLAGNWAAVFNVSAVLFGLFISAGAYLVRHELKSKLFVSSLIIVGICNIGLGVVSEEISRVHGILFLVMSVSWMIAAVLSYKFEKSPFSYLSVGLGAFSLAIFILSILGKYGSSSFVFGFGLGGIERLSVYPLWLWTIGFGAYLMNAGTNAQKDPASNNQNKIL
jgi:hypothetical membrane protein